MKPQITFLNNVVLNPPYMQIENSFIVTLKSTYCGRIKTGGILFHNRQLLKILKIILFFKINELLIN